jgi:mannose-6-phosphate isomerase-like protein (cupin superfamily)
LDGVPSCAPGDGERWQTIRRMFVNERGGWDGSQQELFLLQAIPREWLRPGYRLAVKEMATWFGGKVDMTVEVAADGNSVAVEVKLNDLAVAPKGIRMRLRSGDGRPLAAAEINGVRAEVLPGDTINLPLATNGTFLVKGTF